MIFQKFNKMINNLIYAKMVKVLQYIYFKTLTKKNVKSPCDL